MSGLVRGGYDDLPSHRLRTANGEVCYIDAGEGPAVVMFHGSPLFSFEFRAQIVSLAQHFRVIAPDLLWFGRSTGPVGGADFTTQAGAMRELLDHLELHRFTLLATTGAAQSAWVLPPGPPRK